MLRAAGGFRCDANGYAVAAEATLWHDQPFSALVTLPPLAGIWLQPG